MHLGWCLYVQTCRYIMYIQRPLPYLDGERVSHGFTGLYPGSLLGQGSVSLTRRWAAGESEWVCVHEGESEWLCVCTWRTGREQARATGGGEVGFCQCARIEHLENITGTPASMCWEKEGKYGGRREERVGEGKLAPPPSCSATPPLDSGKLLLSFQ